MVTTAANTKLARAYFGVLAHNHTKLSNHPGHNESDLTASEYIRRLVPAGLVGGDAAPIQSLIITEHSSNPGAPRRLGRLSRRGRKLLKERRRTTLLGVPFHYGLEVSILADGKTDLTPRLADHCELVIASRHLLPPTIERDPKNITMLFEKACANPGVDVIGHPQRYIEDIQDINWRDIFGMAAASGTAIEINFNTYPLANSTRVQRTFWEHWMEQLGASNALIFIGTDIHNLDQLINFIRDWSSLDQNQPANHLRDFVQALEAAKIDPMRVVTSTQQRFDAWLKVDKDTRSQVL